MVETDTIFKATGGRDMRTRRTQLYVPFSISSPSVMNEIDAEYRSRYRTPEELLS